MKIIQYIAAAIAIVSAVMAAYCQGRLDGYSFKDAQYQSLNK